MRIPNRRTLDRRLAESAPQAEAQIQALGWVLSLEAVSDATIAASDGSAFATPGPVWHKRDKQAGIVPKGLRGLDTDADWIQSTYHGWVYSYKAHVTMSSRSHHRARRVDCNGDGQCLRKSHLARAD